MLWGWNFRDWRGRMHIAVIVQHCPAWQLWHACMRPYIKCTSAGGQLKTVLQAPSLDQPCTRAGQVPPLFQKSRLCRYTLLPSSLAEQQSSAWQSALAL